MGALEAGLLGWARRYCWKLRVISMAIGMSTFTGSVPCATVSPQRRHSTEAIGPQWVYAPNATSPRYCTYEPEGAWTASDKSVEVTRVSEGAMRWKVRSEK